MGFVLFLDDIAFTEGVLWRGISDIHILSAIIAVVMTSIVVVGIQTAALKMDRRPVITAEGAAMILLYITVSVLFFYFA